MAGQVSPETLREVRAALERYTEQLDGTAGRKQGTKSTFQRNALRFVEWLEDGRVRWTRTSRLA